VLVALLAAVLAWLFLRVRELKAVPAVLVIVVLVHFAILKGATKNDDHDQAARALLTKVWLAPNGATFDFLP